MTKCLVAFFLATGVAGYYLGWFAGVNPHSIRDFVLGFGVLAPLAFIGLFTVAPLAPFFNAVLALAGGLIFGFWQGSALIMAGALSGGTAGFWIARQFGGWLRKRENYSGFHKLERAMAGNGFLIVFLLRLIPLIPYDIISYGAGFSTVRYRDYILGTALGIIPGVLVYANIGANALEISSWKFYLAVGLLIALSAISLLLKKHVRNKLDL